MNILFICDEYPPGLNGGIGSITQSLAREMVQQGHQVYVAGLYSYEYGQNDYEEDNGVKVWRLRYGFNFRSTRFLYRVQRKMPNFLKSLLYGQRNFDKFTCFIEKLIETEKVEIIEQPDWNTFAYDIGILHPILPSLSIPLVIKSHGSHSYFSKELNLPLREKWSAIDKKLFARADAISFVSKYCGEQNRLLFDIKVATQVLYNALPHNSRTIQSQRLNNLVFFSGTLVQKKGIYSLIKAWNIVSISVPEARLVVFGKGDIKPLKALLKNNTINTVDFKGHQARENLIEYLQTATLSVFPSYSETFGLGAVESLSCGCPTIFTKKSCGPEIIQHGENGLLIDPDNIQEIAEAILLLLHDKELRNLIGNRGKIDAQHRFSLSQLTEQHIRWYMSVIHSFDKI